MKSAKGGQFERDICRQLSEWWSDGKRDDIFWRTSNSGGRATIRGKSGRNTFGQHGDIQAVDPVGAPLMRVICFELKRGYSGTSFADVLDRPKLCAPLQWETFVVQAHAAQRAARATYWALIQRRDRREALIFFPVAFMQELRSVFEIEFRHVVPLVRASVIVRPSAKQKAQGEISSTVNVCGMSLTAFFGLVRPEHIRSMSG